MEPIATRKPNRQRCGVHKAKEAPCPEFLDDKGYCPKHCRANARTSGRLCSNRHIKGRKRCKFHGGNTPVGPDNPAYRNGKTSRFIDVLSADLKRKFINARDNYDQLSLLDDITLADVRIETLIERAEAGGANWTAAQQTFEDFVAAQGRKDEDGVVIALNALREILKVGGDAEKLWDKVRVEKQHKQRLVESERRKRLEDRMMVPLTEVLVLLGLVMEGVRGNVTEPIAIRNIRGVIERHIPDVRLRAGQIESDDG